jgi:hypothetical protein
MPECRPNNSGVIFKKQLNSGGVHFTARVLTIKNPYPTIVISHNDGLIFDFGEREKINEKDAPK